MSNNMGRMGLHHILQASNPHYHHGKLYKLSVYDSGKEVFVKEYRDLSRAGVLEAYKRVVANLGLKSPTYEIWDNGSVMY